jgi:D-lyxose ketol-isomerase
MIRHEDYERVHARAAALLAQAGVSVLPDEVARMEVADFGLGEIDTSGAQIVTLIDTERIAAKLLVMLPHQTEPEHRHPKLGEYPGKEETIRCEWGELRLYVPGDPTSAPQGAPPTHRRHTYTVWHEIILQPGQQVTIAPDTPHWFQGGQDGAVIWSISTKAVDIQDIFTDPDIRRKPIPIEDGFEEKT